MSEEMLKLLKWIGGNLDELTITMDEIVDGYVPLMELASYTYKSREDHLRSLVERLAADGFLEYEVFGDEMYSLSPYGESAISWG